MKERPITDASLMSEAKELFPRLVLASASPNRLLLLREAGIDVISRPQDINEICGLTNASAVVAVLSKQKLESYLNSDCFASTLPAIGIDTLVEHEGRLLGKPHSREEAKKMLLSFSGKEQKVYSGLSLYKDGSMKTISVCSSVIFSPLQDADVEAYLDTEEWKGAAGGYRIQKTGWKLIDRIEGSRTNVIGLPLEALCQLAKRSS